MAHYPSSHVARRFAMCAMTKLVPTDQIEEIVGVARHPVHHYGRITHDMCMFILHSQECVDSGVDLRECEYSRTLDHGISVPSMWLAHMEEPVRLRVWRNRLIPLTLETDQ